MKRGPGPLARLRATLGAAPTELWGAALILAGVLAALGIYLDLTGPFGRAVGDAARALLGVAGVAVPLALVWGGVALVRARPATGAKSSEPRHIGVGAGCTIVLVAVAGLLHLFRSLPADPTSLASLRRAGGAVGLAVAAPLEAVVATWGAAIVLAALAVTGVLVATRTSPHGAARGVAAVASPAIARLREGGRWLTTVGGDGRDAGHAAPGEHDDTDVLVPDDAGGAPDAGEGADEGPVAPALHRPPAAPPEGDPEQLAIDLGPAAERGAWTLPPLKLLARSEAQSIDERLVEQAGRVLERALAAHGVETRLAGMTVGPTVTRYELELGPGVKVARVTSLHKDIAYAMASPDVRILAPIPGRSAIGVEVPNQQRQLVALGDILASEEARRARHPLEVALGRDIAGRSVMMNLAQMPHILIAGATGAGKSSCINSLITSLLCRSTPEQVRLILIDPKRVELGQYNGLPHLLTQVVVNPKKAANALSWAVREMERRYDLLSEVGVRDITGYNAAYDRGDLRTEPRMEGVDDPGETIYQRLPYIVVVVDELNDLMMVAARDVEESICRIAQMARAVGIHLVIATQRPSVNVITGVIKANIPARLAFAVSSLADSRVILDQGGAERLVGQGDMLLLGPASSNPRRIQGSWVGEDEVRKVVGHWKRQGGPEPDAGTEVLGDEVIAEGPSSGGGAGDDDDADLLVQAMELVVRSQLGSTSMLQRKLRVGFARAGRLMDLLEQRGVVGPSEGSKARAVLMRPEELDEALGRD